MKNWIKRKTQNITSEEASTPSDNFTAMNSNSLYSLPVNELVSIIFRFDLEVKNLTKELNLAKDTISSYKGDLPKTQDQSLLYKQHNEALQIECNKLAKDLNEARTSLYNRNGQFDLMKNQMLSKDELIQNYKAKIQDLEKQVLELQITGISFQPSDEVVQLKAKLEESKKILPQINELNAKNKSLESEIAKLSSTINNDKTQIRSWQEKTLACEKSRKDFELELIKKRSEAEILSKEISRMNFLKESQDKEMRTLQESNSQKDLKISKKHSKIESLKKTNQELQKQILIFKYEMESIRTKMQDELFITQERAKDELERAKDLHDSQILTLESKISQLENLHQDYETLKQELNTLKIQKNSQDEILNNTQSELHQKTIKISLLESEIQNLNNNLIESNNKTDLANTEIQKLSQKLEAQKSSQNSIAEIKIKSLSNPLPKEIDMLTYTKNELDILYKSLMKIINPSDSLAYLIKIEDFTAFEKKMNNIVMQVHEQLDEISEEKIWAAKAKSPQIGKAKGRTPVKLFSCMADQDDAPRLIPKPQRPIQQVDSRTVLRRGSAN
ncbi:hypothetical protein SteCoe_21278 [Stentor coeruleus]|uniref:Uncharacterized protein n=1 Tax=Stentor coeruleus TaxID=5963 RepID=A0A1R2BQ21_9CILI|nr:hypothetical protein SteCoe_21278 [Stentor coeruleus]